MSDSVIINITSIVNDIEIDVSTGASSFITLTDAPDSYTGQAGNAVVVKSDESGLEFIPATGTGDMTKAVYDPTGINDSPFEVDNHIDGTTNKLYTSSEKTKLSELHQVTVSTTAPISPSVGDIWIEVI